ncbi:MAG: TolC family protein [Marinilabilia sp.]
MTIKFKFLMLFLGLSFCLHSIRGQDEKDTLAISLEEALDYASRHAFEKISSEYDVASAREKIWETIASGLPQIDFSGQYNHSMDVPVSLLPAEIIPEDMRPPGTESGDKVPVSFSTAYDANYSVSATQMLFDGSYFVGIQATQVFLDLTRHQEEKTDIEIRDAVAKAYFLVLSANENLKAFEKTLEINESLLRETKALYENGFRESVDVSQMKLNVRQNQKQIVEIKRNQKVALSVLRFTMGLSEDHPVKLTDSLDILSQRAANDDPNNKGWAPEAHVDSRIAATNVESQKLQFKNVRAEYLPKINAFYTFQKTGYDDEMNLFDQDWYKSQFVGLSVSIPIFSSGMRHARAQQQKLAWEKSKNEQQQTLRQVKTNGLTALTEYNSAIDEFELAKESEELAREIYEQTRSGFVNGMTGSFELTQQQEQYIQKQISYIQAALEVLNTHTNYLKATGHL